MSTFDLKIVSCGNVFYEGECESITFPVEDGDMTILANHIGFIGVTEVGEVRFSVPGEKEKRVAICSDGVIRVKKNKVELCVYTAERPEEIDVARAQAAMERAKEQLAQQQSIKDYHVSRASLARAMARINSSRPKDSKI